MDQKRIRNFCILAHIDHGKSTLADRFLEYTKSVDTRKMREQFLDMHPLEREKGITIKMQPVRMKYRVEGVKDKDSEFILNLIDTPGHVDFTYEVSRALAAVEGAVVLVDATQGVQAQTLANVQLAQKENIVIIPAINKIDLPSADEEHVEKELQILLNISSPVHRISAKVGTGVEKLLAAIVETVPSPSGMAQTTYSTSTVPLRALIFDSKYDPYLGVIAHVRVFEGNITQSDVISFLATGIKASALEVGIFTPVRTPQKELCAGEIGYIATGLKDPEYVKVGDTITHVHASRVAPLPGYKEVMPMIFASVFPENQDEYDVLGTSLKKLKLEDAALSFAPEESGALGRGYRIGFLGMLHMEIVSERLKREYGLTLVFSNPSVAFRVMERKKGGIDSLGVNRDYRFIYSASQMPEAHMIEKVEEPCVRVEVITPSEFLGSLSTLIYEHEGAIVETRTLGGGRLLVEFQAPLREIIVDFYDELKSISHGFASMAYERSEYRVSDLVVLTILIAGEKVGTLAEVVPRQKLPMVARARLLKLKELLPQELFSVALQAEVEGRIIARETIPAMRKDVTGYLYGGDRTRKMKLWKKQQKGKKRLKAMAHVIIPPEVFFNLFKK